MLSIDTIMFDYGGVVADHYCAPFLDMLANELGTNRKGARDLVSEKTPHGRAYRLDQISLKEFWNEIRLLSPRKDFSDLYVQELWAKTYIPNAAILSLVDYLRNQLGMFTGIVMNEDPWRVDFVIREYNLMRYFNVLAVSYEAKCMKPESKMYEYVLEICKRMKTPDRVLYIDDRKTHVDSAIGCGINGLEFKNAGELNIFLETCQLEQYDE